MWVLWSERNRIVFNSDVIPKSARQLSALVCSHFLLWTGSHTGGNVRILEYRSSASESEED
jgi:hypothetical protein